MSEERFPRLLNDVERRLLRWLLPAESPAYDACFNLLNQLFVVGPGRWGEGNLILGPEAAVLDFSGPVERVFAYGVVYDDNGTCTVVVHEEAEDQIELQFALTNEAVLSSISESTNRYSYSYWTPGAPAPASATEVRSIKLDSDGSYMLVIAPGDERIWLHERSSGVNHLIPHTKFHTELMRIAGYREKAKVFNPKLLFTEHDEYKDSVLRSAFLGYNKIWMKFAIPNHIQEEPSKSPGLVQKLFNRH